MLDKLPPETVVDLSHFIPKQDLISLSATCRRLETILAFKTWDRICLKLCDYQSTRPKKEEDIFKVIRLGDMEKLYQILQQDSVQVNIKWIKVIANKSTFDYAKCKDKVLPIELNRPCQLDQILLHMIPAFCTRLKELTIQYPSFNLPVQLETMISRLLNKVDVTYLIKEPHKSLKDKLAMKHHEQLLYDPGPNIIESLCVESFRIEEKHLTSLVKNFQNVRVLTVLSLSMDITSFKWVPESVVHMQLEFRVPMYVRKVNASSLPNLRSLRISGKFPSIEHVATPNLRTLWVSRVNLDVAGFIRNRGVSDLIVSSDSSMPLWIAADPSNLCPTVKTLVLYNIASEDTMAGFIKLFPYLNQFLCYLSPTFELEEVKFKRILLRKLCQSRIRVMYICAPHWEYKTHEHRINSKRLVMLTTNEFYHKLGYSSLESFKNALLS